MSKDINVKDIEFTSVSHVIQEIKNMNVKGGSPFGRAAAWAYKLCCTKESINSTLELTNRFNEIAIELNNLKPTMATIANTSSLIKKVVDRNLDNNFDNMKKDVIDVTNRIIRYSENSVKQVGKIGSNFIVDNDVVLMHSYSSTLMQIFIEAKKLGKTFKVICTESRPLRESRNAVNILQELDVETVFISDASVLEFLPKVNYVLLGADTLSTDGSVANKMGSSQVAKLAAMCKVPVYVASELFKLDKRTQNGYKVVLEQRTKYELVSDDDFTSTDKLEVINQFFDITEGNDIKAVITEFGLLHPSQMLIYWEKLEKEILN